MAHTGRLYRLAMRRDFLMQQRNNKLAFPQVFVFDNSNYSGIIGASISGTLLNCDCTGVDGNDRMNWVSGDLTAGIFTFHIKIECLISGNPQTNKADWYCIEDTLGNVYQSILVNPNASPPQFRWSGSSDQHHTSGIFEGDSLSRSGADPDFW